MDDKLLNEMIFKITKKIISGSELKVVLRYVLDTLKQIIPYDYAAILKMEEGQLYVVTSSSDTMLDKDKVHEIDYHKEQFFLDIINSKKQTVLHENILLPYFKKQVKQEKSSCWLGIPIIYQDVVSGIIILESKTSNTFLHRNEELALLFSGQAGIVIEHSKLIHQIKQLTSIDELTGLYKRSYFFELAEHEFNHAKRYHRPLSVILFDIDHFKKINQLYGYSMGDRVLRDVAERSLKCIRKTDIMGRFEGEEFIILLPETKLEKAKEVAERIRVAIAFNPFPINAETFFSMTITLNIIEMDSNMNTIEDLFGKKNIS